MALDIIELVAGLCPEAVGGGGTDLTGLGSDRRIAVWNGTDTLTFDDLGISASGELFNAASTITALGTDTFPTAQLYIGRGNSTATQHSVVIRPSILAGVSNGNGGGLTLTDQGSTGTGLGGGISFQSTPGLLTGTNQNTSLERANLDGNGNWTFMVTNAAGGSTFKVLGDGGVNSILSKTDNGYVCIGGSNTSVAQLLVVGQAAVDDQVLVVQGSAGGQTVNTFEVRDTTSAVVASINNSGSVFAKAAFVLEETGVGTDTITIQAPASIAASYTLTLPDTDGGVGEFLRTDGSGVLSWATPSGGVTGSGTDNFVPLWNGTNSLDDSNIFMDDGGGAPMLGINRSTNIEGAVDIAHPGGSIPLILTRQDLGGNNIFEVRTTTVPGGSVITAIQGDGGIWGNQQNSSAGDFRWDADNQDNLIFADVSADGLFLGLAGATARTDSTVCIHGINTSDIPLSVVANTGAAGGTKIAQLVDKTGGTNTFFDDSAFLNTLNVIFTGTATDTNTDGAMRNDSTQKAHRTYINSREGFLVRNLYNGYTAATVTDVLGEGATGSIVATGSGSGSKTLPANFFVLAKGIKGKLFGTWNDRNDTEQPLQLDITLGGTSMATFTLPAALGADGTGWELDFTMTASTISGASSKVTCYGMFKTEGTSQETTFLVNTNNSFTVGNANDLDVVATWPPSVTGGNTITGNLCDFLEIN